ncbi:organic cation transporter protein-like [Haliotis asinina]|uniref:organic cation transporter protein-like n=1 Tax=Haliotis asinina TaxID=109174 RepID=UPI003531D2A4
MANFDDILRHLGEFGRYQKWVYFLLCLPAIPHGVRMMINVYLLNVPDHRCAIPGYNNDTYAVQSKYHAELINKTIPFVERDGKLQYDQCHLYFSSPGSINRTIIGCNKWVYDKSEFQSTAATELNMVCKNELQPSNAQMIFMGGYFAGAFIFGALGDRFGRRKALFLSIVILFAGGLALNWANSYALFVVIRFINGASTAGMFTTCFVIGMEFVGPSKRVWAGIISSFFFTSGYLFLTGVAFFIRDWHTLELVMATPVAVFLIYWWIIPESPRWLLNVFRLEEAEIIIRHAARVNKVTIPDSAMQFEKEDMDAKLKMPKTSIVQLFTHRTLFFRTVVLFYSWMTVSLAYFGLSSNTDNLGAGSLHLNSMLACLVEYPANILCLLLLDRLGRKALLCAFMTLGGAACMLSVVTILYVDDANQWSTVTLSMIGKLCVAGAFSVVYVYSTEIFPTVVRSSALGLSSSFARIGGMVAPYFIDLGKEVEGKWGRALPLLLFGVLSVIAGLLDLALPETLNRDLPETIEDAKNFSRKNPYSRLKNDGQDGPESCSATRPLLSKDGTTSSPTVQM